MAQRTLRDLIADGAPASQPAAPMASEEKDYARIRRNMQKMLDQGATPADIEQYAGYEGVTAEDMQKSAEPNWLMRQVGAVSDAVGSAYRGVKGAVQGQQDPNFADVQGFTGEGLVLEDMSALSRAKLTSASVDDAAYGDIVKKTLGPRLKGSEMDQFGQEVVTYAGDDGKEYRTYINKPGLDWEDADRFVSGAIPYAASATAVGKLTKGAPLLLRALGQGAGAGATSIGMDKAAQVSGSEQPVSAERAGGAALFGAGGEVAVAGAGAIYRKFFKPELFDKKTGTLTAAGVKEAKRMGIDPTDIQGELAKRFDDVSTAANPDEAIAALQSNEFNIPTSKGQRTKDPELLHREEEMRRSLWGPGARDIITDFDTLQKARVQEGAGNIQKQIAPQGAQTKGEAGQGVSEALGGARKASRAEEGRLWKEVPDIFATPEGLARLPAPLQAAFKELNFLPDEQLTPAAHKAMQLIEDYAGGKQVQAPYKILGEQGARPTVDELRRRLYGMTKAAQSGQDKAATGAIYDAFNKWVDDISEAGLFNTGEMGKALQAGAPELDVAGKLATARQFTKEQRGLFAQKGRNDAAGKLLEQLSREGETPERIVQTLFGASTQTTPKAGTVGALKRLKTIFGQNDPAALDQIKAAYWLSMTRGKNGEMLSPGNLRNAIDKTFANQKSVVDVLFTADDQALIKRYRNAVDSTTYVPPNPSGTSYGLASQKQRRDDNVLSYLLRRTGTRATFQGKPIKGSVFHSLARMAPDIGGTAEATRKAMARNAINQVIPKKRVTSPLARALAPRIGVNERER